MSNEKVAMLVQWHCRRSDEEHKLEEARGVFRPNEAAIAHSITANFLARAYLGAIPMWDALEVLEERGNWLTLGDIRAMRMGQEFPVIVMHQNFGDVVVANQRRTLNDFPKMGAVLAAPQFFHGAKTMLTVVDNTGPVLKLAVVKWAKWEHIDDAPVEGEFEPDVLLGGCWSPLINGMTEGGVSWPNLPDSVHFGSRGPFVKWPQLTK